MHRMTQILAGGTSIWLGILLCGGDYDALASRGQVQQIITPPSIDAIRELSDLIVLEVSSSEVVTNVIRGRTGSTSVVVLVNGLLAYGIDLDKAQYLRVDENQRHLLLSLPQPTTRQVAIDPHTSRMLSCERTGLWQIAVGPAREDEAFTTALAIGHDRLMQAVLRDDLVKRARHHAVAVLTKFMAELGWTLEVRWEE